MCMSLRGCRVIEVSISVPLQTYVGSIYTHLQLKGTPFVKRACHKRVHERRSSSPAAGACAGSKRSSTFCRGGGERGGDHQDTHLRQSHTMQGASSCATPSRRAPTVVVNPQERTQGIAHYPPGRAVSFQSNKLHAPAATIAHAGIAIAMYMATAADAIGHE